MKKSLPLILAILLGVPVAFVGIVLALYALNIPQPVGGGHLYNHQKDVIGSRLIGQGYLFPQGGEDSWMRLRTTTIAATQPLPGSISNCSPESFPIIRAWFAEQAIPQRLGMLTLGTSQIDREILNDSKNLRCGGEARSADRTIFGKPPRNCSTNWVLYHQPSGFYYRRYACEH